MLPLSVLIQYFTNAGIVAQGATITIQVAGSVNTLQTTYVDSTGLVANANPMTLNGAGQPSDPNSGAVCAFWVLSGVTVDVYFQDTLGETWSIKNMSGINDPAGVASLQTLLASPANSNSSGSGPVGGVDFVANALKSYDVFSDVRAANAPVLASGQTLTISVQGGVTINDGLGGDFYWNATSTATDNSTTVLKPNSVSSGAQGRWLRLYLPPFGAQTAIASTTTTDVGTLGTNIVSITGVTAISSLGSSASTARPLYFLTFSGSLQLTESSQLLTPGGGNIQTQAGDSAIALYLGSGNWQILFYQRAAQYTQVLVLSADYPVVSNATLATVPGMTSASLAAGGTYLVQVRAQILGLTGTGQGWKLQVGFTGTLTGAASGGGASSSNGTGQVSAAAINATMTGAAVSIGTADFCNADFTMTVNATGSIALQFAQNASSANGTTLKANTALIITRLN
jgi:hypothetical protein